MNDNISQRRTRRAEPINKHTAKSGKVTYRFQIDVGMKPDGSRDRQQFTFPTLAEARREYRRISSEVAAGRYSRQTALTVDEACDEWLAGRRGIRRVTIDGYRNALKPVRRQLGRKKIAQLTKADGDALVEWMLTEGRQSPRHHQPTSLSGRVRAYVAEHPDGVAAADVAAAFPDEDVHTCLAGLLRRGDVQRPARGVYAPTTTPTADTATSGVKPVSARSTLTAFTMVVQSLVDQGALPRNVIALVERPSDTPDVGAHHVSNDNTTTAKSWTLDEVNRFRETVARHRLHALWLLSMYGLRRSEVMGLCWSDINGDTLSVRRGRVTVGSDDVVADPKSRRSRRDLPLPADVIAALRALKARQKTEALAVGLGWSEDRPVAVHEDGTPIRPEWWSDEFHRLRGAAGLRRIKLHGLRNTSVSLMLDRGMPVHIVAAWHGHDPAVSLAVYADAKADELRAAGASLFAEQAN